MIFVQVNEIIDYLDNYKDVINDYFIVTTVDNMSGKIQKKLDI